MRTIVLRGPAGAGKTTLGEALRESLGYPTALVDTDLFNWTTVPGDSNKQVAFDAMRSLAEVYLRAGYNTIIRGLIMTGEDHGGIELLAAASRFYGHSFYDFYCDVDLATAVERSSRRNRDIAAASIEQWWSTARNDVDKIPWAIHRLQMSQSVAELVTDVLRLTETDQAGTAAR